MIIIDYIYSINLKVRKQVRHYELVFPQTILDVRADIGQVLAVPTIGKVRLDMGDDTFRGVHRHTTVVVQLSGLAWFDRNTGTCLPAGRSGSRGL